MDWKRIGSIEDCSAQIVIPTLDSWEDEPTSQHASGMPVVTICGIICPQVDLEKWCAGFEADCEIQGREDEPADGASVMIGIPALEPEPSWDDEPTDPYMFSTQGPWGIFPAQPVAASYVEPGQKLENRTCKQCKNVGSMKVIKEELTFYAFCRLCGRREEL